MPSSDNIWLVRSGTHILGPFSHDSVVEQLLDRSLSSRDEISSHLNYWLPIVDEPAFAKTIEDLRLLALAEEDDDDHTNVNTVANFTITESTKEPATKENRRFAAIESPVAQEEKVKNSVKETENTKTQGSAQAMAYNEQSKTKSSSLIWLVIIAVIGGLAFIVYKDSLKFDGKAEQAAAFLEQGKSNLKLSKYIEATDSFKKYLKINPSDQETYFLLAQAYIAAGQQSEARALVNNENFTEVASEVKSNLLGLTFLKEDEIMVSEKYFIKSLDSNPIYTPALVNSSIANNKIKKDNISLMRLKKSLKDINQYPEVGFLYLMRVLDSYSNNRKSKLLSNAQKFIRTQFSDSFPLYQESQLLNSYMTLQLKNKIKNSQADLIKIIDNDPNEFSQMTFSPLIDSRAIGWGELVSICNKVASAFDDLSATALLSYCRFKNQKYQLAKDVLAINLEKDNSNPLFLALNSLYSQSLGENKAANESLNKSLIENDKLPSPFALPYILRLTNCLKSSKLKCVEAYSEKLLSVKSNSILAQQAKAELEFIKKNYNESHRIASKAIVQAENYIPIQNIILNLGPYVK